ncbi:bacteriocin immunity protein [Enterobacter hormaechei]|uniref:bacteriocin immunity protein n=1 Tax=Enterobacter hormaechei TaxID=158836 RepID=UPI001F542826|nr:bacteriocin immunity protein [Enterobacter hormaechei]
MCSADCETEEDGNFQVREFERLAEHPSGADHIFYPENGKDDSPEGVVQEVKEWHQPHGKPCFMSKCFFLGLKQ